MCKWLIGFSPTIDQHDDSTDKPDHNIYCMYMSINDTRSICLCDKSTACELKRREDSLDSQCYRDLISPVLSGIK